MIYLKLLHVAVIVNFGNFQPISQLSDWLNKSI